MNFKVGDKVLFLKNWISKEYGLTMRPNIFSGDILEIVSQNRSLMTLQSDLGFKHDGWGYDSSWFQKLQEPELTQEELNRAVSIPSMDELGKFLGM